LRHSARSEQKIVLHVLDDGLVSEDEGLSASQSDQVRVNRNITDEEAMQQVLLPIGLFKTRQLFRECRFFTSRVCFIKDVALTAKAKVYNGLE